MKENCQIEIRCKRSCAPRLVINSEIHKCSELLRNDFLKYFHKIRLKRFMIKVQLNSDLLLLKGPRILFFVINCTNHRIFAFLFWKSDFISLIVYITRKVQVTPKFMRPPFFADSLLWRFFCRIIFKQNKNEHSTKHF